MYTYIYDNELADKKYFTPLSKIESRITELGLGGRVCRMNQLRNLRDTLVEELRREPTTIVVVGGDRLVSQMISLMGGSKIPLGIIPLGDSVKIPASLGINEENAVNVLSARRMVEMDLGVIGDRTFLKKADIVGSNLSFLIEDNYKVVPKGDAKIQILNYVSEDDDHSIGARTLPVSGDLTLCIFKDQSQGFFKKDSARDVTAIKCRHITIEGEGVKAILDDFVEIHNPGEARIIKAALNIIVGKSRDF